MTILVTGGAGFIGANFGIDWLARRDETVVNLDKLTYARNLQDLYNIDGWNEIKSGTYREWLQRQRGT